MKSRWANAIAISDEDRVYFDANDVARYAHRRRAILFGVVLYAPFCILDSLAFPDHTVEFLSIRAIAVFGMLVCCLCFVRAGTRTGREIALLGYGCCALGGMFWLATIDGEAAAYFHFGAVVSIFYGGAMFYLRPILIIMTTLWIVPSYGLSLMYSEQNFFLALLDSALLAIALMALVISNIHRNGLERQQKFNEDILRKAKHDAEQALERALKADRTKDNLLAGVSHELRTPMNAIIGFSDAMRTELFGRVRPEAYSDYIGHIHSSGLVLRRNIDDLLDLTGFSKGTVTLCETSFPLRKVVIDALQMCSFDAQEAKVVLTIRGDDNDVTVRGDRERLIQAIINLITNAIKFSQPNMSVMIEISPPDAQGVAIVVSDNGCGIPEAILDSVTDPFVRQNANNHHSGYGGLGVGLTIVQGIMDAMGGSLSIESVEKGGTTAVLQLPPERIIDRRGPPEPISSVRRRSERMETG